MNQYFVTIRTGKASQINAMNPTEAIERVLDKKVKIKSLSYIDRDIADAQTILLNGQQRTPHYYKIVNL